jgi:branched-chain amino acid transport system substrate-binding protein
MTGWITKALFLAAWACAGAAQEPTHFPIVVGAVISQTGSQAPAAAEYRNGLQLWMEQVNAAGGLLARKVELRLKDDGSQAARAGPAYAELVTEGAHVLIGPYGSAATLTAAAEAERSRRIMLNAAGPSSQVHRRSPRYVFQTAPPYSAYAHGVIEVARAAGAHSLFIAARDDVASREMGEAALALAKARGFPQAQLALFAGSTEDFLPQLYQAMAMQADGWIGFGEARDAADMVKTFKLHGFVPRVLYARASLDERFLTLVGQDAEFVLGSKDYDAGLARDANRAFVAAYAAKWSRPPGSRAVAGYVAGTVLAEALRRAGAMDTEKLRAELARMELHTLLGRYRVDATGAQVGMKPPVMQIVKGRPSTVWPPELAERRALAAFPAWNEREVMR